MDVLLNWLVQGGIVAAATAGLLRAIPSSYAQARCALVWAACLAVLTLPALPLAWVQSNETPPAGVGPAVFIPVAWWSSPALWAWLWLGWAFAIALRAARATVVLRRIRAECRDWPAAFASRLEHWPRVSATGRPSRLVLSTRIDSAAVFGCGAPLIAVAPELLDELSAADLDRMIVHEWAHVQRRDDLSQLVQLGVRIVAGWHPAVWWLDRQIRHEREAACDAMAVAVTGSAKCYAACLATLASRRVAPTPALSMLPAVSSCGLRRRLVRILSSRAARTSGPRRRLLAIGASATIVTLTLLTGTIRLVESAVGTLDIPLGATAFLAGAITGDRATLVTTRPRATLVATSISRRRPIRAATSEARRDERGDQSRHAPDAAVVSLVSQHSLVEAHGGQHFLPVGGLASQALGPHATPATPHTPASEPRTISTEDGGPRSAWTAAASVGVAIGRGSQEGGVRTAGFFSRFGNKIAGSF